MEAQIETSAAPVERIEPLSIAPMEIQPIDTSPVPTFQTSAQPEPAPSLAVPPVIQEVTPPQPAASEGATLEHLLRLRQTEEAKAAVPERLTGICRNCQGHVEAPRQAVSEMILCPHCLKPTLLIPVEDAAASASEEPEALPAEAASKEFVAVSPTVAAPEPQAGEFPPLIPEPAVESARDNSFEMRLGTYWFVRAGIVMVLTALAWAAYLAYEKYIPLLGPPGKTSLLYLASGTLLGIGAWFQRRQTKEALRNYGQVVFAGGLAAVYFTTYAAHHIPALQIIESAALDGALLLAWAGFIVWL